MRVTYTSVHNHSTKEKFSNTIAKKTVDAVAIVEDSYLKVAVVH